MEVRFDVKQDRYQGTARRHRWCGGEDKGAHTHAKGEEGKCGEGKCGDDMG